ncbi:hypothetical protein [Seonamhaeicola sp.]|uniref:hypothetical protein n=1 Tax=Seonamhaeicola sp. TaxID=1912245 RepID=UPI00260EF88C|nr:hypothetical protein [Seonamhaeicola sp.]
MVKTHNIRDIYFVLSTDNQIIVDALGNQDFSGIGKLNYFYNNITKHKKQSEILSHKGNPKFSVLSHYLNIKIKELQLELNNLLEHPVKIQGKIYDRQNDLFRAIYSNLICLEKYHLN